MMRQLIPPELLLPVIGGEETSMLQPLTCSVCGETGDGDFRCRCLRQKHYAQNEQKRITRLARIRLEYIANPEGVLRAMADLHLAKGIEYTIERPIGATEPLFIITKLPEGLV
jgi:hypothetical protein